MTKRTEKGMDNYKLLDWQQQYIDSQVPTLKRLAYTVFRRYWDYKLSSQLQRMAFTCPEATKFFTERGYDACFRSKWAAQGIDINNAHILVHGTGNGSDVINWAALRPKSIVAVDLFAFDSWESIERHCQNKFAVDVNFIQSPLEADFGLKASSIDLIVSDAVYEHCKDLPAIMQEAYRILKPGGCLYASYGPLWYCASGDHFSGREALSSSYNHLLLDKEDYHNYITSNQANNEYFQDGARYIELGLFSYLSSAEYKEVYLNAGFKVLDFWCQISQRAMNYYRAYPDVINTILQKEHNKAIALHDLLIKSHQIRLLKSL